jgi:hypothetical protein
MDAYLLVGIPNNFVEDDNMHNVCLYIYIYIIEINILFVRYHVYLTCDIIEHNYSFAYIFIIKCLF